MTQTQGTPTRYARFGSPGLLRRFSDAVAGRGALDPAPRDFAARAQTLLKSEVGALRPKRGLLWLALLPLPRHAFPRLRARLYGAFGARIGRRTMLLGPLEISGGGDALARLTIGSGCILNAPLFVDLNAPISIGDGTSIGHHCVFITSGHDIGPSWQRAGALAPQSITVESGCWIGAGATLLPGVTIGRGSVVMPGSLVAADVAPNKLVGGVPARIVKALPEAP
ncbi:MAG: acyltransferase [Acidobacteriota bacterium]